MPATKRTNLIDPQVLGAYLDVKLIDAVKLSPIVNVDNTLVGQPGSTLDLPKYKYIGIADGDIPEGQAMVPVKLQAEPEQVQVKKAGKAVSISDEAMLAAYGDPVNEIGNQLLLAMADRIETDLYAEMAKATLTHDAAAFNKDAVADALVKFGEDIDGEMYLFIAPKDFAELRKDKDFIHVDNGVITGERGMIHGCRVVVSNRVGENAAYIMKPGALALVMKRNVMVEADRDILKGMNVYACNEHYAVQLRYEDKVIKINIA
jgi:hypothetical protein